MEPLIPAFAYKYVYIIVVGLLFLIKILSPGGMIIKPEPLRNGLSKALLVGVLFVMFFGFRPVGEYMYDTSGYALRFIRYQLVDGIEDIDLSKGKEIIWEFIGRGIASLGYAVHVWFLVIAVVYIGFNIWGCRLLFPNHVYLAFLTYIIFFLFYQGGVNGIRNADAYSIVFCAICLYATRYKYRYVAIALLFACAYEIHSSVAITILAFVAACTFIRNTKIAIIIWLGAVLVSLSAGNILAEYAIGFTDDARAERYLMAGQDIRMMKKGFSHVGFRWDFLLFSLLPILFGGYVTIYRRYKDRYFSILLNTYILANAVWVIFIYAAFSNRFAMLSWCIYPYVMLYPCLRMNVLKPKSRNSIVILFLSVMFVFSWYMNVFKGI